MIETLVLVWALGQVPVVATTVSWEAVTRDVNGQPETVAAYEVEIFEQATGVRVWSKRVTTTQVDVPFGTLTRVQLRVEVRAFDAAGNRSGPGYVVWNNADDVVAPVAPVGVTVK